ncbi:chemotaxis protein CheB [Pseudorhodoferax soli]|uniref:protein-glutamate methylesterase n=1 Tax=Pseudorhodoferax soli TaxID=545864 RepID=A0A368XB79_9BURK|nr:two-component system chemotaxis response regulator CheB [Pseudorhodoferax soli]
MSPAAYNVIVVGASAGGVDAMLKIAGHLPANFPAPILLVQHLGAHPSALPDLLAYKGPNRAKFGEPGEVPEPGVIYVAPSDSHMLIEHGRIRVWKGPKIHHTRPAIDPLFRSAAMEYGARAVGVVLTGTLDDGTAGLKAIKECGGLAVVQDPDDAREPSMPLSALAYVEVDHLATLDDMPALLGTLALAKPRRTASGPTQALRDEHAASFGGADMRHLKAIGAPSVFTCPDCGGSLFELKDQRPVRFACHTGHAYSLRTLAAAREETTDSALWASLRALQEKEAILRRLAEVQEARMPASGQAALGEAQELAHAIQVLRRFVEGPPRAPVA